MDNVHRVEGLHCQHQVGQVHPCGGLLKIDLLLKQPAKGTPRPEVEHEAVEVFLAEGVVELHIEGTTYAPVYFLLFPEGLHPLLIQVFDLHHLHREKVTGILLPHQEDLTVGSSA